MSVYIDAGVACIIARELLEGTMFTYSHYGTIIKNKNLDDATKKVYYNTMAVGVVCGIVGGFLISIGFGFGLSGIKDAEEAEIGIEMGEGMSKLIGAFFVMKMMLKIPKWFGISNFKPMAKEAELITEDSKDGAAVLEPPRVLAMSLFWNVLREFAEAGCFTALDAFFSEKVMATLGESVGVGIGAAVFFAMVLLYGGFFMNVKYFAIVASVIIQMLAVGLFTGAAHAFEEVHEMRGAGEETPDVWRADDDRLKQAISVFAFFGLKGSFTALQFVAWIGSAAFLTFLQMWHNYYGKPIPSIKTLLLRSAPAGVSSGKEEPISADVVVVETADSRV